MSASQDGSASPLPAELDRALRQATDRTLAALTSLRKAVRQQVHAERKRGVTLPQIEFDMRAIVAQVQERMAQHDGADGADGHGNGHGNWRGDGHGDALTAQVIQWSTVFFNKD